jgi:hypothetical protein
MPVATRGTRRGVHERRDPAEAGKTTLVAKNGPAGDGGHDAAAVDRSQVRRCAAVRQTPERRQTDAKHVVTWPSPCIGDETHAAGIVHARLSRTSLDK